MYAYTLIVLHKIASAIGSDSSLMHTRLPLSRWSDIKEVDTLATTSAPVCWLVLKVIKLLLEFRRDHVS